MQLLHTQPIVSSNLTLSTKPTVAHGEQGAL